MPTVLRDLGNDNQILITWHSHRTIIIPSEYNNILFILNNINS